MRVEWIELQDSEIVGLQQVPFFLDVNYRLLLSQYEILYGEGLTVAATRIAQKIINLHDRVDEPGQKGFAIAEMVAPTEQELILERLPQLNTAPPKEIDNKDKDYNPPWASGNYRDDLIADLIQSMGSYQEVRAFLNSHSTESVENIRYRIYSINLGPTERERRNSIDWWEKNCMNDPRIMPI